MNGARLAQPEWMWLLWLVPAVLALFAYAFYRRRAALRRFANPTLIPRLNASVSASRRGLKTAVITVAIALLAVAIARPVWNPQPQTVTARGRDVVFLLDVSRSMLADDLKPNRLERAKLAIQDCLESLEGDRVGLVVFAGSSVVKCPLTVDYGFFRMILEDITPDSVARGGTQIGDAVRKAMSEVFNDEARMHRDIVLITDGEDHESAPIEAAEAAGKGGVRILAIGLGDEATGTRVPVYEANGRKAFLTYQGREVWSKLDAETLRNMAAATPGGRYLNVATGTFDLGAIYRDLVASEAKNDAVSTTMVRYTEGFQWLLAPACLLLMLEAFVMDRRRMAT